jgi:hypothetical protein
MPTANLYFYCHILTFTAIKVTSKAAGHYHFIFQLPLNEKHWFTF